MSSIQATRMKKGMLIKMGNDLFRILELQHFTPGNKRGFVQSKMRNIRTNSLADHKFRAEDDVERATLDEREMQYLYRDGEQFTFMDLETYEQLPIDAALVGDAAGYMAEGSNATIAVHQGVPIGVELPASVALRIVETQPAVKGDTRTNAMKPATLETGHVVQVPLFVEEGERVKVDTRSGAYIERVK